MYRKCIMNTNWLEIRVKEKKIFLNIINVYIQVWIKLYRVNCHSKQIQFFDFIALYYLTRFLHFFPHFLFHLRNIIRCTICYLYVWCIHFYMCLESKLFLVFRLRIRWPHEYRQYDLRRKKINKYTRVRVFRWLLL